MATKPGGGALECHLAFVFGQNQHSIYSFFYLLSNLNKETSVLGHYPFKVNRLQE